MAPPNKKGIGNLAKVPEVSTALSEFDNAVQNANQWVADINTEIEDFYKEHRLAFGGIGNRCMSQNAYDKYNGYKNLQGKLLTSAKKVANTLADAIANEKYYCKFSKQIRTSSSKRLSKNLKLSTRNIYLDPFADGITKSIQIFKQESEKTAKRYGITITFNEQYGFTVSGKVKNTQELQDTNHIPGVLTTENVKMLDKFKHDLSKAKESINDTIKKVSLGGSELLHFLEEKFGEEEF